MDPWVIDRKSPPKRKNFPPQIFHGNAASQNYKRRWGAFLRAMHQTWRLFFLLSKVLLTSNNSKILK